jgi:phenylacetate-CoA ligase
MKKKHVQLTETNRPYFELLISKGDLKAKAIYGVVMPDWLKTYNILPYPLRVIAASLHGFRLQALRYSTNTDRLVAEALARENWTSEQWNVWQQDRLAQMLWHASRNIPYYRQQWQARRRNGDKASVELLENWSVLSKDAVRDQPRAFVADGINLRFQIVEHTSGTTGKPLTLWMSKDSVRQWYALFEARWRTWYGLSRHDRWGILGGQMIAPFKQKKPPFWVWNAGMNQLYLSSYHLAPQNIGSYMNAIQSHKLLYLLGYASSLYSLAQLALEQNLNIPALMAVISNAEPLYAHQREVISKVFQCPVYDTYGLSENVCAASECLQGRLHLWAEVGVTEVLDENSATPLSIGETGRLVCTGLLNLTMPLIRYDVGDEGFFSTESVCACGRSLPILGGIEGRKDDVLLTRDGRRIGRLDPVFKADLSIREAQIIQESLTRVKVRYVPAPGCASTELDMLIERLQERLGEMEIVLESVEQIPRSSNGKFRAVISNIE